MALAACIESGSAPDLIATIPCVTALLCCRCAVPLLQAVQLALDRKDRERELVSALLPQLVPATTSGARPRPLDGGGCNVAALLLR